MVTKEGKNMSGENETPRTPQELEELRKKIKSELKKEILEEILILYYHIGHNMNLKHCIYY